MAKNRLKILFFGTADFAVESLDCLLKNNQKILAVVTAPDKPSGRGRKMSISPIKEYCLQNSIPCLQPTNLKSPEFQATIEKLAADINVIVAFRMLPQSVWDRPALGSINLHASLLPNYRGAAPINWALINGETETGVTTFFLKHEIDTGKIIFQEKEPIFPDDNVETLYKRLKKKGSLLLLKTVIAIACNSYSEYDQNEKGILKKAPKIFKNDCEINWNLKAQTIHNFIRGLSPYPTAWTLQNEKIIKIFSSTLTNQPSNKEKGEIWSEGNTIYAQTGDFILKLDEIQIQGKKRMPSHLFLMGNKI